MTKQLTKAIIIFILASSISLSIFPSFIQKAKGAQTWRVPEDYPTIGTAIIAASAGDTIKISQGNYSGFLVDKSGIFIMGIEGATINSSIQINGDRVQLRGLTHTSGELIVEGSNILLAGNKFSGCSNIEINCDESQFLNNFVDSPSLTGFIVYGSGNVISRNTFHLYRSSLVIGSVGSGNDLLRNMISSTYDYGFALWLAGIGINMRNNVIGAIRGIGLVGNSVHVVDNLINCSEIAIDVEGDNSIIGGNEVFSSGNGIEIGTDRSAINNTIQSNRILVSNNGIVIGHAGSQTLLEGNEIEAQNIGIHLKTIISSPERSIEIRGNTISNCATGILLTGSDYSNIYLNNLIDNEIQAIDDQCQNNAWFKSGMGNFWSNWVSPDSNNDGIVDKPHVIQGTSGSVDKFPLVSPVSWNTSPKPTPSPTPTIQPSPQPTPKPSSEQGLPTELLLIVVVIIVIVIVVIAFMLGKRKI